MNKLLVPFSACAMLATFISIPLLDNPAPAHASERVAIVTQLTMPSNDVPVIASPTANIVFDREYVTSIQKAPEPVEEPEEETKEEDIPEELEAILVGNHALPTEKDGQKLTGPKEVEIQTLGRTLTEKEQGNRITEIASKYLGSSYVWGGVSPTDGWDCSGYVQYVFKEAGITLPRVEQWVGQQKIKRADALPGDLIVQDGGSHVGIYAGNGMMYSALNPDQGTMLHPVDILPAEFYRIS